MASLKLTSATILTMNDARAVVDGDLSIRDGRIAAVGGVDPTWRHDRVIDVGGALRPARLRPDPRAPVPDAVSRPTPTTGRCWSWLRERVWPLEAAHDARVAGAPSARLAAAELLLGGTTTVLTMETVHDTDAVFEALAPTGLRAVVGKCLMDAADGAPARLLEPAARGLDEAAALARRWHGAAGGRLSAAHRAAVCGVVLPGAARGRGRPLPRAPACWSTPMPSEQQDEVALVRARTGVANVEYLAAVGLASPRLCLAHCVWVDDARTATCSPGAT